MAAGGASAATLVVDPGGGGDAVDIQSAVDLAATGDSIRVLAGIYTGTGNKDVNFGGKNLVLFSDAGSVETIIDCEGLSRAFLFNHGEGSESRIDGFTITGGDHSSGGGAIYCFLAAPTVVDCRFTGNHSPQGGAIYALGSAVGMSIQNCSFENNTADYGGAVYATGIKAPTLTECRFDGNSSDLKGGAVYCTNQSSGQISGCVFNGNSSLAGGAIFLNISSSPAITGCTFDGNDAGDGGAIGALDSCEPEISSCTFCNNSASQGGSLNLQQLCQATIRECIMAFGVTGNVMVCGSSTPETYHNLIWGNGGGDILCGNYHDNIYLNPQFCDVSHHGPYTLQTDSPAAAANNAYGLLIGAWPVDCGENSAEASSWSRVKSRY